jgi:hypothetical protein
MKNKIAIAVLILIGIYLYWDGAYWKSRAVDAESTNYEYERLKLKKQAEIDKLSTGEKRQKLRADSLQNIIKTNNNIKPQIKIIIREKIDSLRSDSDSVLNSKLSGFFKF